MINNYLISRTIFRFSFSNLVMIKDLSLNYNFAPFMLLWWSFFFFCFNWNRAYAYSSEDVQMIIESMAAQAKEPTFCMGDDIPLAVISQRPHMLYDYFKQRFAQVC